MANSNKNFTMIYYYIPEDLDEPDTPNVFGMNMSQDELRMPHIKSNFPLEGDYHFRFKCKINNSTVWLDLESEDSKLPLYNGRVFVKATRISWNLNEKKVEKNTQQNNNLQFSNNNVVPPQPAKVQPEFNLNWNPSQNENNLPQKSKKESDLLDFDQLDLRSEIKTNSNKKKKNDDLIDF